MARESPIKWEPVGPSWANQALCRWYTRCIPISTTGLGTPSSTGPWHHHDDKWDLTLVSVRNKSLLVPHTDMQAVIVDAVGHKFIIITIHMHLNLTSHCQWWGHFYDWFALTTQIIYLWIFSILCVLERFPCFTGQFQPIGMDLKFAICLTDKFGLSSWRSSSLNKIFQRQYITESPWGWIWGAKHIFINFIRLYTQFLK